MTAALAVHPLVHDPQYLRLKQHLIESTGLAYYNDKDNDLASRIAARISELSLADCAAYLNLLTDGDAGEPERHLLIGQLTIGETYFFRHTEQFDGLRDVVFPDLIRRNQATRSLRIWSAGCAVGAEPYTIAILLKQHFGDWIAGWDVRIIGTDINQSFLARASRGEFDERALRSTPDDVKRVWFVENGRTWTVRPFLKDWVSFQYHNLVEHPYPSIVHGITALDLILCRNVMIYFDWAVIAHILGRFHECLVDGGWLAVGHAESNTEVFGAYRTVNVPGATLYQKSDVGHVSDVGRVFRPGTTPVPKPTSDIWPTFEPGLKTRPTYEFEPGLKTGPTSDWPEWKPPVLPAFASNPAPQPTPSQPTTTVSGIDLVRRLADEGKWNEAATECSELLAHDQMNAALHFYQALVMEQTRRLTDAEQAFRKAIYLDRSFALAHYHLALLLEKTGRRDAANQSLRNVQGLLSRMNPTARIADADGLSAEDLGRLVEMHLDLWRK